MNFDTSKLAIGAQEVKDVFNVAEMLGLEVIKVVGKKRGHTTTGVCNFEIGRENMSYNGPISATMSKGYVYLYPEKSTGIKWGFVLDTDHNRKLLASHLSAPIMDVATVKIKKEIIAYCDDNGINIVQEKSASGYVKKSVTEKRLEDKNNDLEAELRKATALLTRLEQQKEETELAILRKEQYHAKQADTKVEVIGINAQTGEAEETNVSAKLPVENKEPVRKPKASKADKPLSKVKLNKN